jgi:hypothetical protein
MKDAVITSETSVNLYQTTWRNIPEGSHLNARRRDNLKYHLILCDSSEFSSVLGHVTHIQT